MLPNEYLSATNHRSFTTSRHPLVVERFGPLREVFEDLSESDHALPDLADLVLADGLLDVRKDEILVELDRLVIVGRSFFILGRDEVDCPANKRYISHMNGKKFQPISDSRCPR